MTEVTFEKPSVLPEGKEGSSKPRGSRTTDKLSEERLEKKRAADRHAQRVLREKTKRHIEELEEKVAALSNQNGQEAALKAAKKRTLELENELAELRTLYEQKSTEGTLNVLDQPSLFTSELSLRPANPLTTVAPEAPTLAYANASRVEDVTEGSASPASSYGPSALARQDKTLTNDSIEDQRPLPTYRIPKTFVKQPSLHVWEYPLANKAPANPIDFVMSSVIQRQKEFTAAAGKQALTLAKGPRFPNITALIMPQEPTKIHPVAGILSDMLRRLTYRTFIDKIAALLVIYPVFQWQIANDYDSYVNLQEYAKPTLLQRSIPHPIWVCAVGWPPLRDILILNQEQYCTEEFQYMMVHSLNCNWPYGTEAAISRTRDGFTITKEFWDHIRVMENWSLEEPFISRYPELEPYCRFAKLSNSAYATSRVGPV